MTELPDADRSFSARSGGDSIVAATQAFLSAVVASLDDAEQRCSGFDLLDPTTSASMTVSGPSR